MKKWLRKLGRVFLPGNGANSTPTEIWNAEDFRVAEQRASASDLWEPPAIEVTHLSSVPGRSLDPRASTARFATLPFPSKAPPPKFVGVPHPAEAATSPTLQRELPPSSLEVWIAALNEVNLTCTEVGVAVLGLTPIRSPKQTA